MTYQASDLNFLNKFQLDDVNKNETNWFNNNQPFPDKLPVLPMEELNIFPLVVYPILVEEPGAQMLIKQSLLNSKIVALFAVKPNYEDPLELQTKHFHKIGMAVFVHKVTETFPGGPLKAVVQGLGRIKLNRLSSPYPYKEAEIKLIDETWQECPEITALLREVKQLTKEIIKIAPYLTPTLKPLFESVDHPGVLCDLIVSTMPLKNELKVEFIALTDIKKRLAKLVEVLSGELEIFKLRDNLQEKVQKKIEKKHKEYHLREQLKIIQEELGDNNAAPTEHEELKSKIEKKKWTEITEKIAWKKLQKLQQLEMGSSEYSVVRNYLDWILELPWVEKSKDEYDLQKAKKILNHQHHGLEKVKKRILEFLAVKKLKNDLTGPILCLTGPPGVGKTSLAKSLADALGRKFIRISLGGLKDEAEIKGHRRTYVGARPGRLISSLRVAQTINPLILLDEIDKISQDFSGDPTSALLELLDPEQNKNFSDHYLEIPYDFSQVIFIMTANVIENIPLPLQDRMEIIEISSYTSEEKVEIARKHLLPQILESHGLTKNELKLSIPALKRLINDYTREAGCRDLTRKIQALGRAVAVKKANDELMGGISITPSTLKKYLGPPRYINNLKASHDQLGVVTGLAWTSVGGEILFVEAAATPGNGQLKLTGQLGKVMQESAQAALTYIESKSEELKIDSTWFGKYNLHIHLPQGGIPKDGPSAGVTIATALVSLATGRAVKADLAMTGEISLTGQVHPVGGIKEKVLAAKRSGIKQILIPQKNEADLKEISAQILKNMDVKTVTNLSQILNYALI